MLHRAFITYDFIDVFPLHFNNEVLLCHSVQSNPTLGMCMGTWTVSFVQIVANSSPLNDLCESTSQHIMYLYIIYRFGHKKEKHTGAVEIFPCPDCGKNFSRKSNLKVSQLAVFQQTLHFCFRHTEIPYILAKSFPVPSVRGSLQTEVL